MVARIVSAGRKGVASCACALALAGCGGGSKQDAGEAAHSFPLQVVSASFPAAQSIARPASFTLTVRNPGSLAVPDLAVTIDSFSYTSNYPNLAARQRPVWVIERGAGAVASPPVDTEEVSVPGGGQTAYVNTWAFGRLAPGATRTLTWQVVPVKAGTWTVHYELAAGLAGRAKALAALRSGASAGGPPKGHFTVRIAPSPKLTHVNPDTGRVEVGQFPAIP